MVICNQRQFPSIMVTGKQKDVLYNGYSYRKSLKPRYYFLHDNFFNLEKCLRQVLSIVRSITPIFVIVLDLSVQPNDQSHEHSFG